MTLTRWWQWLQRPRRRHTRPAAKPRRYRLHFDDLEERCLLAILPVTVTGAGTGAGSLVAQLTAAQPGDEIVFDPAVFSSVTAPQTINLASTLTISKNVTITGPGANLLTLQGNGASSVISVDASATVTISGVKITGGGGNSRGAGISNQGNLT